MNQITDNIAGKRLVSAVTGSVVTGSQGVKSGLVRHSDQCGCGLDCPIEY